MWKYLDKQYAKSIGGIVLVGLIYLVLKTSLDVKIPLIFRAIIALFILLVAVSAFIKRRAR